jgi:hypothetical protein
MATECEGKSKMMIIASPTDSSKDGELKHEDGSFLAEMSHRLGVKSL